MAYIGQGIKQGTFKVLDTSGNTYNGSNTTFSLGTQVGAAAQLIVSHDGVIQLPGTDYTLASGGASITFSTAPASGASIFIIEISGAVGGTVTPSDNSVGITQLNVSDGSSGQALTTNGSGTLSFASVGLAGIDDQSSSNDDQLTITDTAVVINEDSDDVDFRVESNGNANMLFVSGGNDVVGVGAEGDLGSGLHVKVSDSGGSVSTNADNIVIEENGNCGITMLTATNGNGHIFFGHSGDQDEGFIVYDADNNRMRFGAGGSEMTRIGNGFVSINTTSRLGTYSTGIVSIEADIGNTDQGLTIKNSNTHNSGGEHFFQEFLNSSGNRAGVISHTGATTTAYTTSSDYRLKQSEELISDGITRLKQLKPYKFNWKSDASGPKVDGFFAHEVSNIVPESIIGKKDAVTEGDEPKPIYQGIDQAKLVPLLTAALQEAVAKIETLEARVTTLEG